MDFNKTNNAFSFTTDLDYDLDLDLDLAGNGDGDIDLDLDPSVLIFPGGSSGDEVNNEVNEEEPVSTPDALVMCIRDTGGVDIRRIASMSGVSPDEAIEALRGAVFCDPDKWGEDPYTGWQTSDEYLSGNLRYKLIKARIAYKLYKGTFIDNIKALEGILPPEIAVESIYVTPGSPWLPEDVIDDFVNHLIQPLHYDKCKGTRHDPETGSWEIPDKGLLGRYVRNTSTFGTKRIDAVHILENTLNMKMIRVTDEVPSRETKSGTRREVNQEETAAALEKQRLIIAEFRRWIWSDSSRTARLTKIYEDKYGYNVARRFDGSFLTFPGISPDIALRPYQKNAVARILFTPNTLLAHDVGAGKTYIMAAAGMELQRLGMAHKVMYTVPNNIVEQWHSIFLSLYPDADLLVVRPKDFRPDRKKDTLLKIRDNKYDAIIIAYSCFDSIPLSRQFHIDELRAERDKLLRKKSRKKKDGVTAKLTRKIESLDKKIAETILIADPDDGQLYFDELGVDRLFVDEAHNYKNVSIDTTVTGVYGISSTGSAKCNSMLGKVRYIQNRNRGGGVVMATGTPVTNSVTDIFVFQQYLQSGELELLGLQTFQSWVAMFAEKTTEFEIAVDTNSYRLTTRFSRFHNIPELTTLLASVADFHRIDTTEGLPLFRGYTDVKVPRSAALKAYLKDISKRADKVHAHKVKRTEDNMLKITSDGRKAALDVRLVQEGFTSRFIEPGLTKAAECAERAAMIYRTTTAQRSAQLIFCDISTPGDYFNIYDEVRRLLIGYGVRPEEIAYIHDAATDAKREKLFARVRSGEIRILIGSTFKLGLGVNIQDRLIALHHLDVPWRPADMVQREGRILRHGNQNPEIFIYRYITEGSFDAYSWQLLETKQKFIVDILSGTTTERSGGDVDDTVLDYAEIKALALGNPLLRSRVETRNEISRLSALRKKSIENRLRLEKRYDELPDLIAARQFELETCKADEEFVETNGRNLYKGKDIRNRAYISKYRRYLRESLATELSANSNRAEERNLFMYRGFSIILPAGMDPEHPYVVLVREGRYRVELGEKDGGVLVRIDNYLDKLGRRVEMIQKKLDMLLQEQREIETELAADEGYADLIEKKNEELRKIDEELGVNI